MKEPQPNNKQFPHQNDKIEKAKRKKGDESLNSVWNMGVG